MPHTKGGTVGAPRPRRRRTLGTLAGLLALALLAGGLTAASMVPSLAAGAITVDETCTVDGPLTQTGSTLISVPMAKQIAGSPLPITFSADVAVTPTINPGNVLSTTATLQLDTSALAHDILEQRVKPGVVSAGYPALAPTAWVVLSLDTSSITFTAPPGTTPTGTPTAHASAASASVAFAGSQIVTTMGAYSVDTRSPAPPLDITVSWSVTDGGAPAPRTLDLASPTVHFTAGVTVGLLFFGSPVTGGVSNPWACTPSAPPGPLASTAVVATPVSTTVPPSTTTPASSTSTVPPPSTTTTTWPSTTTTPAGACAISGFDHWDGYTGMTRDATGFFRTEQIGGRWWLVDPDGHPFFSQGINHVTWEGTPDRNGNTPYRDAVTARYGTHQAWTDAQRARMRDWGYNTLGAWSDGGFGDQPYTVLLNLTNQNWSTGVVEDLWAPGWTDGVAATINSAGAAHKDDPALVGYWLDNELHWGPDWRAIHLFEMYLERGAAEPGKQVMLTWLQSRYPTFADFAADFTTTATDWASLANPTTVTAYTPTGAATRSAWVGVVAERYFSYTSSLLKAADPNHLNLGPRFIAQTAGRPLLEAAAKYVDVASFNLYVILPELVAPLLNADPTYLPVDGGLAAQQAILHKPMLISEWSFRAADSGMPNTFPPLFPVLQTQAQRAAAYESYVTALLNTTWIVGQHWFEHADEPPAGRFDGEDSNFGLVDAQDDPYPLLTGISKTMHDCAYARILSPIDDNGNGGSTTTTTAAPVTTTTTGPVATAATAATVPTGAPVVVATPSFTG